MIYKVKKGKHDFWPFEIPWIYFKRKTFKWVLRDMSKAEYDMRPDEDQWDWNKGGGVSFSLTNNNKDAVMWAWRYNPNTGKHEYCMYIHDGTASPIIRPRVDDVSEITLVVDYKNRTYDMIFLTPEGQFIFDWQYRHKKTISKRIGLWFGGANNEEGAFGGVAPQDLEIELEYC